MKSIRDELHELLDAIDDKDLDKVKHELERIRFESMIPSVEMTEEELKEFEKA